MVPRLLMLALVGAALPGAAGAAASPLFAQRCAMCHQAGGGGLPGQFPRLSGRVATIAQTPAGRHYLAAVLLNGMVGRIAADGQPIAGLMPSMAALADQQIADILTYAAQLAPPAKGRKPAPFTAAEIAAVRREGGMNGAAVAAMRAKLPPGTIP